MHRHQVFAESANCRRALDQTRIEIMITYQHAGHCFAGRSQKDYGTTRRPLLRSGLPGHAPFVPRDVGVTANFKETQLLSVRPGNPVDIRIDTYPHRTFKGHVDSIQAGSGTAFSLLPAENATGNYVKIVQRVPVKIVFDEPPDVLLGPGMSVVPTVRIK